jgi:hypothetical protein
MSDESANSKNGKGKIGRRRPHTLLHKRPVGSVAFFLSHIDLAEFFMEATGK